jgi:uncharacterized protein GlcG (DUF336 family)
VTVRLRAAAEGDDMAGKERARRLGIERLETREVPNATASLVGGNLVVTGDDGPNRIVVNRDEAASQLVVTELGLEIGRFNNADVSLITIDTRDGVDSARIRPNVLQQAIILSNGKALLQAGGGPTSLFGGTGSQKLIGGPASDALFGGQSNDLLHGGPGAPDMLNGGEGADKLVEVKANDTVAFDPADMFSMAFNPVVGPVDALGGLASANNCTIDAAQVGQLLDYASAATSSNDAIIAIVDRNGRILGVRVEDGVDPAITGDIQALTFAIDGAVAKARTGAFFGNNQAPLTSRVIEFISQTTITEREVNSNPNIPDPNSTLRGPGFVAPIKIGSHFPPNIANTPQVDLFAIEHTNRDSIISPGPDRIREGGGGDDILLSGRFNINPAFVPPGQELFAPESYGFATGLFPSAQSRGIATLPGGIPLFLNNCLVGGIGVFFPGKTGFATEENSSLGTTFDPTKRDRSLEAEYIAFVTAGGAPALGFTPGPVGGANPVAGFALPLTPENMRIDLVGITLDIIGPGGIEGPARLVRFGQAVGPGVVNGTNRQVNAGGDTLIPGLPVPEGYLVVPHDGVGITAAQVNDIIVNSFAQAALTRAAIRLPLDSTTRMVIAVTDLNGEVVGLFRMPDATVFSIDVAVAKARNVAYYANANQLQPIDQIQGVPAGTAFTNRTFRYAALPFFPEAIDSAPPGPFSILNDDVGGVDRLTGRQIGPRPPASQFQSVLGFDAFNPQSNFRQQLFVQNQNGIVFFPGSAPLYNAVGLIGGFGISGDGVDQDDVVTFAGSRFNGVPDPLLRADEVMVLGIRLPYQKFNRQPLAN